jgi:apolipoprotein N-acyltransferase
LNTLAALLFMGGKRRMTQLLLVLPVTVVMGAAALYSLNRWQAVERTLSDSASESIVMGVVQGNIDQSEKWSPENQQRTITTYIDASQRIFGEKRPEILVWPETALPFYLQTYTDLGVLSDLVAQYDTALLTGAPWFELIDKKTRDIRYYNSAQLLEPGGSFRGSYYKSHLVPFGEYVPMKKMLPFLAPLVVSVGDFSAGHVGQPLEWRGARLGVLICFESIFPDIAREWVKNGANVLVNLTNDAWYGKSSAPYHSLVMSVFRAVETRRSVVRSANTGVSGFIDPLGRVSAPSQIFTSWARSEDVSLLNGQTVFVRWGHIFPIGCLLVGMLLTGLAMRGRSESAKGK